MTQDRTTPAGPPRGAPPRVLLASAAASLGKDRVVDWCVRLLLGQEYPDDPDLAWLGGAEDWASYWRRVWGTRGLLYVWDDSALEAIATALQDDHWRVREMGLKVVRAHGLSHLTGEAADLREDTNARVRAAVERALAAMS